MAPRQDYRTPPWLFRILNKEFGPFTLDAFANDENHLCEDYFTEEADGFTSDWGIHHVFANPPFNRSKDAVEKAYYHSAISNKPACLLLQAGVSTRWFHLWATTGRVLIPDCRINYWLPGVQLSSFNRDSLIVLFGADHWGAGIQPYYIRSRREKHSEEPRATT